MGCITWHSPQNASPPVSFTTSVVNSAMPQLIRPTTSKVFKNGAFDLLEKPVEAKILIDTIHNALALSEHRAQYQQKNQTLRTKFSRLTVREKQILHLVLAGYTNKMTGDKLYLALRTVEIHRHNMMKKMDSDSPVQLAQQLSRYPEFNELFLIP
ncbi:response regulator transcription factor [Pragia fontium]|uniref:Regulatory protein, luxR family n=1 Tax=Pragia fontium DSM 5563 = ATCC 49100 TaxID=1122977 RepID=A0AAJ5BIC1_9GAMM|nr:LuxR C-terminal-related transcriptional regulator [Pragia fontium]SFD28658.1 regulatory protein, luxR family [Pragia fontium DSM 5563 = ATCC 49100]VEJ56810.1 Transcriptional regulatory protein fixJ [Pragia fontium]